ncbi:hypothetical protein ADL27_32560 [Streptomyces sp. NRRL F-6602]|nr:hypothetical protein ADL27_32560 [Streptomyces sp. NRRL F-6602]
MDAYDRYRALSEALEAEFPGLELHVYWSDIANVVKLMSIKVADKRQGTGSEVMRRICAVADENGHRIALTPDTSFGSSKAGLIRFYKRFGFVNNTGRKRDLTISETMIREPQEGNWP